MHVLGQKNPQNHVELFPPVTKAFPGYEIPEVMQDFNIQHIIPWVGTLIQEATQSPLYIFPGKNVVNHIWIPHKFGGRFRSSPPILSLSPTS